MPETGTGCSTRRALEQLAAVLADIALGGAGEQAGSEDRESETEVEERMTEGIHKTKPIGTQRAS